MAQHQPVQAERPAGTRRRSALWMWIAAFVVSMIGTPVRADDLRGVLTLIGHGPERPVVQQLAHAFEKAHPGTAVDITWNRNFRIAEMVTAGEADLAISGEEVPGLEATIIAWDGLAIVVNFSNPVKEVTTGQVAALFSGRIRKWSDVDEQAEGPVVLVLRPDDQNLNSGLRRSLGIDGSLPQDAMRIRSDQRVLSRISGQLDAVGYLSLQAAVEAMHYGMSVRVLFVDGVEPGKPTVQSGQYALKRPLVLLRRPGATPLTRAFVEFSLSKAGRRIVGQTYVPLPR